MARGFNTSLIATWYYAAIREIDWPDGFYRRDIGWRALD
jgi:phosphoribosylamine--glycine ligase